MTRAKEAELPTGQMWFVGSSTIFGRFAGGGQVIVPMDAISGMSDEDIGRNARSLLPLAGLCRAEEVAENLYNCPVELLEGYLEEVQAYANLSDEVAACVRRIEKWILERDQRAARRARRVYAGNIYLIGATNELYKIGKSIRVDGRFRDLLTISPVPLTLLHHFPVSDMQYAEDALHDMFDERRSHGEWFALTPDEVQWFCSLTGFEPQ